jgi:hypothetical protein
MNTDEPTCFPASLDDDCTTLHIRCGSDIYAPLREAGFTGDFLEYSDPVCQGPVPDAPDLIARRAVFLAKAYGPSMGFDTLESLESLVERERQLKAAHEHHRVVLWFEHDSYDQTILARCLAHFADGPRPAILELICIDRHISVEHFIGLGQLKSPDVASLWPARTVVTNKQLELGRAVWTALRHPDPSNLAAIAATGTPPLPLAAPALWRHLQELPGATDGLSMTQRLVLGLLSERPRTIGRMFAALMEGREPLPFLGDLMFLYVVEQMALTLPAIITIEAGENPYARTTSITEIGRQVLAGHIDTLSLRPLERWVGGVVVDGAWRWSESGFVPGQQTPPPRGQGNARPPPSIGKA